ARLAGLITCGGAAGTAVDGAFAVIRSAVPVFAVARVVYVRDAIVVGSAVTAVAVAGGGFAFAGPPGPGGAGAAAQAGAFLAGSAAARPAAVRSAALGSPGGGAGAGDAGGGADAVEQVEVGQHAQLIHPDVRKRPGLLVLPGAGVDVRVGGQRLIGRQPVAGQRTGAAVLP